MPDPTMHKLYRLALGKSTTQRDLLHELTRDVAALVEPHLELMRLWGDFVNVPDQVKQALRDQDRGDFGATLDLLRNLKTEEALIGLLVEAESAQLRNYSVMRRVFPARELPRLEELVQAAQSRLERLQEALKPSTTCSARPPNGTSDLPV